MLSFVLPVKKPKLMIKKYYTLTVVFVVVLFALQFCDYFFYKFGSSLLNQGFIFGQVLNNSFAIIISIILIVAVSLFLIYGIKEKSQQILLVLVLAGAISNILDRLIYGGVIDYINFFNLNHFNFADVLIVLGLFVVAVASLKKR